ncbi:helix-turn-helix domain-containing protein [Sphingomonas gei]|uniref:Helix-turn-helix domain-containing protein n=1 Tax=Sphingomonas gei TaxID=1395960 RepID=A0A4S1XFX0_9SPHN|nr:helix-turn-helix domain-containing protein [Sphingomonas gei]TGX54865.1 helix-turn-helix domain-containing protein [Sphingomonas gei]
MEGESADNATLFPATVGEKLRAAREAQKLELSEVASRTRIPQRHLEAIENGTYIGLPSITYTMGFAKAYARAVGADEVAIGRQLREELGDQPERPAPPPAYDFDERSRVPSRSIAWVGAVVAILVLIGVGLWYGTDWFRGTAPSDEPVAIENVGDGGNASAAAPTPAPIAGGQVTLVATDTVWLRISDASGKRLFEKEMAAGERYDVPAAADRPRIRTGRPDRLQVLVNGSNVAPLGTGDETVEADISAAALQARGAQSGAPATPSAAPGQVPAGNTTAIP